MAQNHNVYLFDNFFRCEGPPQLWLYSHQREEIGGDKRSLDGFWFGPITQCHTGESAIPVINGGILQTSSARLQMLIVAVQNTTVVRILSIGQQDQTIRVQVRKRSKHDRFNNAEHSRVHANSKGKRDGRNCGEPWSLAHLPQGVANVL